MATQPTSRGRAYFWAGIGACLLGLALAALQLFGLKHLDTPWSSPALATLGALLLVLAVARRRTIPRVGALVLVAVFAGYQWYFLAVQMKLPDYAGPARAERFPAFRSTLAADGRSFTETNLSDGRRRVLVFFRGRW